MAQFPFVGGAYRARSKNFNAERCINLYPETGSPASKTVAALYGTPGLRLWSSLNVTGSYGIRGMVKFSATLSVVISGNGLYEVTNTGVSTLIGLIDNDQTIASMASNGEIIMIVTGNHGYFYNPATNAITVITDPDFTGADTVYFLDGYFVFNQKGTGRFQITELYGTDIDSLDFATAEGSPDLLLSLMASNRELWLFGETSTEVYFNSGNSDFPFERINGAFIEIGCAAKFSPAKIDNTVYWLAADDRGYGTVQRANGYTPQRVSDHGVEYAISQMSRIDDAVSYTYQQGGHSFYVLNFPTAQQTWVFDSSTNMWHQRAWRDPASNQLKRHRAQCQMTFAGLTIVGDWERGLLYVLDPDYYTDNGDPIARIRTCPHLSDPDYRWQFYDSLQIDMQTGVGLDGGVVPGSDPKAMLQWSDDGGYSWSNELWASIGKIGERRKRVRWTRLGKSRDRVFQVTITDPVSVAFIGAAVQVRTGRF
jgi:hypothetical protein